MNMISLLTDSISEILIRIINFTCARQKYTVQRNVTDIDEFECLDRELLLKRYYDLILDSIDDYVVYRYLAPRSIVIKYGSCRSIVSMSVTHGHNKSLSEKDRDEYYSWQNKRVWENSIIERDPLIHKPIQNRIEYDIETPDEDEEWPKFASRGFSKIIENCRALENANEDKSLVLYHIMEIETLLGKVENEARVTDREYEARLAASLRDICRIHEPADLTNKQIECIAGSLQALVEGWGALNREKVKWIRRRLLEVGLTWLPVTQKAQKVIDEAKSSVK